MSDKKKKPDLPSDRKDYSALDGLEQEERLKRIISGNPMIYMHINDLR